VIAVVVLLIIVLGIITGYVEKLLWMRQLDYADIFWTLLSVQWAMFCSAFVFAFLYLSINLRQAVRNSAAFRDDGPVAQTGIDFSPRLLKLAVVLTSAAVALFFSVGVYAQWDTYLRFRYGGSFGVSDPLFGVDVGFYLFHLPFYEMLQSSLMLLTVLALVTVLLTYVFFGILRVSGSGKIAAGGNATSHLSVLLFILVANWGFGLYLDHYNLVYSTLGIVYGAGYARVEPGSPPKASISGRHVPAKPCASARALLESRDIRALLGLPYLQGLKIGPSQWRRPWVRQSSIARNLRRTQNSPS
jgi:uncharacterized protein